MKLSSILLASALAVGAVTGTGYTLARSAEFRIAQACDVGAPSKESLRSQVQDAGMDLTEYTGLKGSAIFMAIQQAFGTAPESMAGTDEVWVVEFAEHGVNIAFFAKGCFVGVLQGVPMHMWEHVRDNALPPA